MPTILNDHDCPLQQVGTRLVQHTAQPLNYEVGARVAQAKQNNTDDLLTAARKNFTKIEVEG
jgi:hypothetical protein